MEEILEFIELEIIPIPPETVDSARKEIEPLIQSALQESGKLELLSDEQMRVEIAKTFPTDAAILVGLTLLSGIALETYKELILPLLKQRFAVTEKSKKQKKKRKRKN